jgi:hypothetical protein
MNLTMVGATTKDILFSNFNIYIGDEKSDHVVIIEFVEAT